MDPRTLTLQSLHNGLVDLGRDPEDPTLRRIREQLESKPWLRLLEPTDSWPKGLISRIPFESKISNIAVPPPTAPAYMQEWLAVGLRDGSVIVCHAMTGEIIKYRSQDKPLVFRDENRSYMPLAWNSSGQLMTGNGMLRDVNDPITVIEQFDAADWYVHCNIAYSSNDLLAVALNDHNVAVFNDSLLSDPCWIGSGHDQSVTSMSWNKQGQLATCSFCGDVRVWNPQASEDSIQLHLTKFAWPTRVAWNSDNQLVIGLMSGTIQVWNRPDDHEPFWIGQHPGRDQIVDLLCFPDGLIAAAVEKGNLAFWQTGSSTEPIAEVFHHRGAFNVLASNSLGHLLTGSADKWLATWNVSVLLGVE